MNIFTTTFKALKLPLNLLFGGRRKKVKRTEREEKQIKHVRNFSPTYYSWQQRLGKKLTKKQQEYYQKKLKKNKK